MSQRTIDTSSTIIESTFIITSCFALLKLPVSSGVCTPRPIPKNEWIVCPPAFSAATPVGATTAKFFSISACTFFKNVVFPVPAFPVKKKLVLVLAIMSKAYCCSVVSITISFACIVNCENTYCQIQIISPGQRKVHSEPDYGTL